MRFKWAGTEPVSMILGEETRNLTGGWWEVYEILALMLGTEGKTIPEEYLRTTKGRGIELPHGEVLNTNLCFDDVIPRIRKLAELHGKSCEVKWKRSDGMCGTLELYKSLESLDSVLDDLGALAPASHKPKIVVIVFDTDAIRNDPGIVQTTIQSALNL